jgi:hypothetical protein
VLDSAQQIIYSNNIYLLNNRKFRGIADFVQLKTEIKLIFQKLKRSATTISGSFSPPEFFPTEIHKTTSP